MKYVTVTHREGEELGPVDWDHPMAGEVSERDPQLAELLRAAESDPAAFEATTYGGWPRIGWGKVVRVVMYDGWPYWSPTPTVVSLCWSGAHRYDAFNAISGLRRAKPDVSAACPRT